MLSIKVWRSLSENEKKICLARPVPKSSVKNTVQEIINKVRHLGDQALFSFTEQFDGARLDNLQVPKIKLKTQVLVGNP